ncbi:hypothetical protein D9M70_490120 [compost metagenome]
MQAHRRGQFAAEGGGALQQRRGAGLDTVGQQGAADEAAMAAVEVAEETLGGVQPGQAAWLVPVLGPAAVGAQVLHAAHVAGAEVGPQAQLGGNPGHGGELVVGFRPFAVIHRGDRHGGGDAVADQLGEGVAVLEDFLVEAVALRRAALQVLLRPHPAHEALIAVVQAEHGGVEVAEGVQVDEAGAEQGIAVVDPALHRAGKSPADEEDAAAFDHHLAVAPEHVARAVEADHAAGLEADARRIHRRLSSRRPWAAISLPAR